jgi:hypothetical protein
VSWGFSRTAIWIHGRLLLSREASEAGGPSLSVAETIGRLHMRDDGADLEELLVLLEEKEWGGSGSWGS